VWAIGSAAMRGGKKQQFRGDEIPRDLSFSIPTDLDRWRPLTFKDAEVLQSQGVSRAKMLPLNRLKTQKADLNEMLPHDLMRLGEGLSSELKLIQNINQGSSDLSDNFQDSGSSGAAMENAIALRKSMTTNKRQRPTGHNPLLRVSSIQGRKQSSQDPTAGDRSAALQQFKVNVASLSTRS
jgi:hypothetical protein